MAMVKPQAASDLAGEIDLGGWVVTEESVREYTRAVGDFLPYILIAKWPLRWRSAHGPWVDC